MNTDTGLFGETETTKAIIGAAYEVSNTLGAGFLEKVYENALLFELEARRHQVEQQKSIEVWYKGRLAGIYQADLVVDSSVVVELKSVISLDCSHRAQCLNYLRATGLSTGLVINFGRPLVEVQRVVGPGP